MAAQVETPTAFCARLAHTVVDAPIEIAAEDYPVMFTALSCAGISPGAIVTIPHKSTAVATGAAETIHRLTTGGIHRG